MDDRMILQLYYERSEQAITETQKKYGAYCHKIAMNILENREECEEVLNDVFWKLWNTLIPPNSPERLQAYVGTVTRNLALSRDRALRADKRGSGTAESALEELESCAAPGSIDEDIEERRLVALLNQFLAELPRESRIIFVKRYWYLSTGKQIAAELNVSEGKVKMNLTRTRKRLKEYLKKEGFEL